MTLHLRAVVRSIMLAVALCPGAMGFAQELEEDFSTGPTEVTGVVLDDVGEPVPGAHIFVESARPRKGSTTNCPSCYPDCSKQTRTDAKGEFTLPAMDSSLLFRVVLVAKGYEATAIDKVDPLTSPLSFALWKRPPLEEGQVEIHARIYNSKGKPAVGALLDIQGAETGSMTTWGGHKQFIQGIGVSDEDGLMTFVGGAELKAGLGILQARNYAPQWVRLVPGKDQVLVLRDGVTVSGQVVKEGKPLPGLQIGFTSSDRAAGEYIQGWRVVTDASGRFGFTHLTAAKGFIAYSVAKASAALGVLPSRPFTTGTDGSKLDLGAIEVQPPLHIRGRVVLEDGEAAFPGSKVGLGREQIGDYQEVNLDEDGQFEFKGLAQETVEISLRISGYKCSKKNPNRLSSRTIAGRLGASLSDFLIYLEPTEDGDGNPAGEDYNWAVRETPLQSARK